MKGPEHIVREVHFIMHATIFLFAYIFNLNFYIINTFCVICRFIFKFVFILDLNFFLELLRHLFCINVVFNLYSVLTICI